MFTHLTESLFTEIFFYLSDLFPPLDLWNVKQVMLEVGYNQRVSKQV